MIDRLYSEAPAVLLEFFQNLLILPIAVLIFLVLSRIFALLIWAALKGRAHFRRERMGSRRNTTLRRLVSSVADLVAGLMVLIFILSQYIAPGAIATTLGLFSAGIGFAARPFISDLLGGLVLLFEDQYSVGEKVEIGDKAVMGVVELVSLRVTAIRGESGELWIVPNGDVRTLRNFSRASYSPASIRISVPTARFDEALVILHQICDEPGQDVIERPEIISEQGMIGEQTELMLKVKATFGSGVEVRRRLLAQIQQALLEQQIIAVTQKG